MLAGPGDQVDKVVQLYEVMLTRHTTMVVGQTGGGKSVILQTLARAQVGGGVEPGWMCPAAFLHAGLDVLLPTSDHHGTHCAWTALPQGRLGRKTTLHVLNPKAISVSELYGVLDKDTRDWTDGLLSNMFR